MAIFSYGFFVLCALFWPTDQSLLVPDSCGVSLNPLTRTQCGSAGVTRESCIQQGCCYDDSDATSCSSNSPKGNCFKPANCAVDKSARTECGWVGMSRTQCQCRGCCFDSSATGNSNACFKPAAEDPVTDQKCSAWVKHTGRYIASDVKDRNEIRKVLTLEQCKEECETYKEFKCESYFYRQKNSRCTVSAVSHIYAKENGKMRNNTEYELYTCKETSDTAVGNNTCANWVPYDDMYIMSDNREKYEIKGKKLTLEECKNRCETYAKFKCVSYFYNKVTFRCTISSVSYDLGLRRDQNRTNGDYVLYSCRDSVVIDTECKDKKMDVIVVLDSSSSISNTDFDTVKIFAKAIADKLPINNKVAQFSLIIYATTPDLRISLNNGKKLPTIRNIIQRTQRLIGSTRTDLALEMGLTEFNVNGRASSFKILILLTDGDSEMPDLTKKAADKIHAQKIRTFSVGVGNSVKQTELDYIASNKNRSFTVADFSKLEALAKSIPEHACVGAPVVTEEEKNATNPEANCKVKTDYKMCQDIPFNKRNKAKYMIDPDGPDSDEVCPFIVTCNFNTTIPETILHHGNEGETCVDACTESVVGCNTVALRYDCSEFQAAKMIGNAKNCRQAVQLDCRNVGITGYSYWKNRNGTKMGYWPGGSKVDGGGCECGKTNSCATANTKCNCDTKDNVKRTDKGIVTDLKDLPISQVAIGDIRKAEQKACYTIGPLICS